MIAIPCPQCQAQLEIDDGFRGGVCRCFECGTLMTVPEDPESQNPEPLIRQSGGGGGAAPKPRRAAPRVKGKKAAAPAPTEGAGTYRTASGKKVEISEEQLDRIPVAARRKIVRWGTRIAIVLGMLALTGGVAYGAYIAFTTGKFAEKVDETQNHEQVVKDIIHENFFLETKPYFMGVETGPRTVIAIDGSQTMGDQPLVWATEAVLSCYGKLKDDQMIQAIIWKDSGPAVYPKTIAARAHVDQGKLKEFLYEQRARGVVKPGPAIELAMKSNPTHLILVAKELNEEQLAEIDRHLGDGIKISVLVMNDQIGGAAGAKVYQELRKTAEGSGGKFRSLVPGEVQKWYDDYRAKNQ